jgi:membrane-associated phospholipid phosphatase
VNRSPTATSRRMLWACAILGGCFLLESVLVTTGSARIADREVAQFFQSFWFPPLQGALDCFSEMGSSLVTGLLAIGLFVYLRRTGFEGESWAVLVLPMAVIIEVIYKQLVFQPPPGLTVTHPDGPALLGFLPFLHGFAQNAFPSGHMVRTVIVYGLIGFVVRRLAPPGALASLAMPAAVALIALMALDRLYLGVHWQSDVFGGLFLGGVGLAAAVAWLEQPWRKA